MQLCLLLALLFELSIYLFRRGGETVSVVDLVVPRWEPPSWKDWDSVCEGCGVPMVSCLSSPACLALVDDGVANMRASGGGAEPACLEAAAGSLSCWRQFVLIYMPRYNLGSKSIGRAISSHTVFLGKPLWMRHQRCGHLTTYGDLCLL